jgi:signal transduction histidine kinase
MLYVISHDLREPLRAIEQFSQIVNDRYAEKLDTKGADFLGRTVRAARRMRTLLDDLLELSRARRLRPPDEPVEGHAIVSDVLERVAGRIEETHAVVRVARDLPSVRADRVWAVQALTNLVVNALKFTCNGQPPEVEIAGYRDAGTAGFVVRDKGAGVAPEHAERIFRLFQRAVGREIEGTGAGLAIVAAVAERHGGRAWVEPREGGGSEFAITFADAESRAPEVAA